MSSRTQATAAEAQSSFQGPLSSIHVDIPDYNVITEDGNDYVSIPGGSGLIIPFKPAVPIYNVSISFPGGLKVQDVIMKKREGLQPGSGFNIPLIEPGIYANDMSPGQPPEYDLEWYPERDFDFRVSEEPNDSTTLVISIYPFYYNANTGDVKFYNSYDFDINYTTSEVKILQLKCDKLTYELPDVVYTDLYTYSSSQQPRDLLVEAVIETENAEFTEGMPIRILKNVMGLASCSWQVDTANYNPGNYMWQVEVKDVNGAILDKESVNFTLGVTSGHITTLTVEPSCFDVNDDVNITAGFQNDW